MNVKEVRRILHKDVYTLKELLSLGIFSSRSTGNRVLRENKTIEWFWVTPNRRVILTKSLISYLENMQH